MSKSSHQIYPAYTFRASPTYFEWVKLAAVDVHTLRSEPGFEGQNLYFHHNHPIRFVCLTGFIISIEDIVSKYTLIELDDGSGAVIVVKITRLAPEIVESVDCPSNTTVSNLNIITGLGKYDVVVDGTVLDVGAVIKVKCTIGEFRGVKQLELKRIWVLQSTGEEACEWEEVARWKRDVLDRPWVLASDELRELEVREATERKRRRDEERVRQEKERAKADKRARWKEKMAKHEEKAERTRRKEEVMMNAGALKGSNELRY